MTNAQDRFELNDGFEAKIRRLQTAEFSIYKECLDARRVGDTAGENAASLRLIDNHRELRAAMKAEALKFNAETKVAPAARDDEKVSQFLGAFVRGLRLTRLWRDVLLEPRIAQYRGQKVVDIIQPALDRLGRRGDLEAFLSHPDLSVRATAASWLLIRLPEKCVPILKDIQAKNSLITDAGLIAHWALVIHERDPEFLARSDKSGPK